jgi:hypothetical protein
LYQELILWDTLPHWPIVTDSFYDLDASNRESNCLVDALHVQTSLPGQLREDIVMESLVIELAAGEKVTGADAQKLHVTDVCSDIRSHRCRVQSF